MVRKLDHIVLPVADLAAARQRLTALGFNVAPDGRHPFGTANCCVYFEDDTFMEPLAVADPQLAAASIRKGNVFVARDHVFRSMIGDEGMSAIVLTTDDAERDRQKFEEKGIGIGDMLSFSRPFVDAKGTIDTATFRLAFAGSEDIADAFVFTCERVNAPNIDRSALTAHANGALSMARILIEPAAETFLDLIGAAVGEPVAKGVVKLGNTLVGTSSDFDLDGARTVTAVAFRVADLHMVADLLRREAIDFRHDAVQIAVPPASGQGVTFIFEANK